MNKPTEHAKMHGIITDTLGHKVKNSPVGTGKLSKGKATSGASWIYGTYTKRGK